MSSALCMICGGSGPHHDHKADLTGLDDGPYLPGRAPRKKAPAKSPEELRAIRAKAWATRRASSPPATADRGR